MPSPYSPRDGSDATSASHRAWPETGLAPDEARRRLERDGPNVLPVARGVPAWRQLLRQMLQFFALMLWVAAGLAFVARLPQLGVAIVFVVVLNGVFSFVQEYRAERAAERIRDLLPARVTVVRGGEHVDIDAGELVRGDVVLLGAGDRISADLRCVDAHALRIDTSALTGESEPFPGRVEDTLYAGTFVVEGEGTAIVEQTGSATRLAGIAQLTRATTRPVTPLALELRRVVRTISVIAIAVGALFFLVALPLGTPVAQGFTFAIGVTVALVPEGLLPTVTLSLALGAQRMAQRHALVRRLESVETLGSTTFICTDKTGTLTQNEMAVVDAWTPSGTATITGRGYEPEGAVGAADDARPALVRLALVAARCGTGHTTLRDGRWVAQGDPMEAAIDVLARRLGASVPDDARSAPELRRFPFDPRRRRMSIVCGGRLLVKGAPDALFGVCRDTAGAQAALDAMTARGLRVIAAATREIGDRVPRTAEEAEQDLVLLGLLGLEDPPRPGVDASIAACRGAGMRVAMVTGDHPATAKAIAKEVGLLGPEEIVLTGAELPDDPVALGDVLDRDGIVLARISPEDKLRIARALRARGHVVAMTGDGVNDGPALQEADIGVAMGRSGTDVAREAADLVLLDDDFSTIVEAIRHGRATFLNVRRFLTYHLTDNVAELTPFLLWALSAGRFPLAIGVLQVLALDIGTDTFPAVALGAEAPAPNVLERPPASGRLLNRTVARRAFGLLGPTEAVVSMTAFVVSLLASGWRPGRAFPTGGPLVAASGAAFAAIVLGQMANAFACRSTSRWPGSVGWLGNRLLLVAVAFEILVTTGFLVVPPVARAMHHAPPSAAGWVIALLSGPVLLAVDAANKALRRRSNARRGDL